MLRWIVIALLVVGFGTFLTYEMMSLGKTECSLCLTFKGIRQCTTAKGPDQQQARLEAHRNACAIIAHGVTETLACQNTPTDTATCK